MNRTFVYHSALCLLLWLMAVVGARAQSLEYWFDNRISPQSVSLSGGMVNTDIDARSLKTGLHTLHLRVKDGSDYSPVYSTPFLKFAQGATKIQYWFDGDVENYGTADVDAKTETVQLIDLDMRDSKKFPLGLHQLSMRIAIGGNYSPVYNAFVLKLPGGGDKSVIEYWFDGDVENRASMPVSTETEEVQIVELDMKDTDKFPLGLHQLSMRIADKYGSYSPVYNALVMRMPAGTGKSVIEYWFDDDNTRLGTIPVSLTASEIQKLDLDLSSLENFPYGPHRLNMRVVAYGNQYSPVYSTMVMRWPNGPFNYIAYWLDDDYDSNNLKRIKASGANAVEGYFEANLNFRDAAPGMHRLHYRVSRNAVDFGPVHEVPILITRKYVKTEGESVTIIKSYWADDKQSAQNSFANGNSVLTWGHTLDPNDYSVGQHSFRVRFQNSAEVWSEENVTYFYKDAAMSRLHEGFMPDDETTGIEDLSQSEVVACECENGTIYVDCLSPKLGKTGVIMVYDMMGKVVAQQKVTNDNGIHAALSVENFARQILIVKLVCGDMRFSRKIINR